MRLYVDVWLTSLSAGPDVSLNTIDSVGSSESLWPYVTLHAVLAIVSAPADGASKTRSAFGPWGPNWSSGPCANK